MTLAAMAAGCKVASSDLTAWTLQKEGDSRIYTVNVPCTVAGALNEAGYFGENILEESRYRDIDKSVFDGAWVFKTRFGAASGLHHVLKFGSLDYSADIFLNGTQIASADTTIGNFCVREFDITALAGRDNELEVKVYKAPGKSLNAGYVDWNPRPVDESMGILRKVELISTPDVEVKDVYVKPELDPADLSKADIRVVTTLVNRSDSHVSGVLKGVYDSGSFEKEVSLAPGEEREFETVEHIDAPRIWWSRDMGTPELYTLEMSFVRNGKVSHSGEVRFGIRDIKSRIDENGSLQFTLNGRDVLIKSAGWTDDIFMQDTPARTRKQLEYVCDMGLNSVRFENIWGKDDTVYDLCDEMGLLAIVGWSCQWEWEDYCGYPETKGYGCINDPETEALAIRYFHDQLIRLRNHPAIIGWLTGSDRIPNPRLETEYMKLYNKLEYRPYICSASSLKSTISGPSGTKMLGPYEYVGPDYWYIDRKYGGAYGFNTETGIGMNIPQAESVRRMVGEGHLWPFDANWDYHCTASASHMNNMNKISEVVAGLYGKAVDFGDFMKKAHAVDFDGTRAMFEAFRCNVPRTTGIVQWMLNSAWPSLYWQLYDWYLVPTAGYYGVKKACAPLQLVYDYAAHAVYAVDDSVAETSPKAVMHVYGPDSKLLRSEEKDITAAPRKPLKVFEGIEGPCFLRLELRDGDTLVSDNFYCVGPDGNEYDWKKTDWCVTPIKKYDDLGFVTALPATEIEMETEKTGEGYRVTLRNDSDKIAYQNILKALDGDGELVPGVVWSDNFLTLCPGESRTVSCRLPEDSPKVTIIHSAWNAKAK